MRRPRSLRARILTSLILLSGLYTLLLLGFMVMTYEAGQESAAQRMLVAEGEGFRAARSVDPAAPLPRSDVLHGYLGRDRMPARYRDNLHRFAAEDYAVPLREWKEIQLWQGQVPGADETVYIFLDLAATSDAEILGPNLRRALTVSGAIFFGFALWMGVLISRRLSRPLADFTASVQRYDPAIAPAAAAGDVPDGEIGVLAQSFASLHDRIQQFVDREKQFTRNASHELRTPITVIRGAQEILRRELPAPSPRVQRALQRIETASDDMASSVETFLWLAREEAEPARLAACPTASIVERCVSLHRGYLRGRDVAVEVDLRCASHPDLSPHLFRIAVTNLIRNAFQHTRRGRVRIWLDASGFGIRDTGPGIPGDVLERVGRPYLTSAEGTGSGLGLSIVDRIAGRCGWIFLLGPADGGGTQAELRLGGSEGSPKGCGAENLPSAQGVAQFRL